MIEELNKLPSPDDIQSAEYREIMDLLREAETIDEVFSICHEFMSQAHAIMHVLGHEHGV